MHGSLRFLLAIAVAVSHLGITIYNYNPGVSAVVIFYLLAGMVAYKLIYNLYPNQPINYYKDRIKRIFPMYFLALIFSFIVYLLGAKSYFISAEPTYIEYLSNIIVIPLSYFMYTGIDKFTLLPPVWSLGVELQFYLLAPFILLFTKRVIILISLSFIIYVLANIGFLHTDYFGYRLLPGVMFIFLIGTLIQKSIYGCLKSRNILISIYIFIFFLALYVFSTNYKAPFNHETIFALIVGIPFLYYVKLPKIKLDKFLGNISYPIFLYHFPIYWLLEIYYKSTILNVLVLTIIISIISLIIERKLIYLLTNK